MSIEPPERRQRPPAVDQTPDQAANRRNSPPLQAPGRTDAGLVAQQQPDAAGGRLDQKRHLGYKFVNNERILRSWAAWAMTRRDDLIVADTMLGWAVNASSSAAAGKRLSVGRRFAVWLQAEDLRHAVPPPHVLGRTTLRWPAPYLLTDGEIGTLMEAALSLRT